MTTLLVVDGQPYAAKFYTIKLISQCAVEIHGKNYLSPRQKNTNVQLHYIFRKVPALTNSTLLEIKKPKCHK